MCEPTTIIGLTSLAIGAVGQNMQANAQRDSLEASARTQADEVSASATQQVGERVAQARRERARLRVSAGEAGIGLNSNSFEAQIENNFGNESRDVSLIRRNTELAGRRINQQLQIGFANTASPLQILANTGGQAAGVLAGRPPQPSSLQIPT